MTDRRLNPALPVVLMGSGGHGRVLLGLLQAAGRAVAGVCDPRQAASGVSWWQGVPVLGGDDAVEALDPQQVVLANGVGQLPGSSARRMLHERMRARGFQFATLVHPAAWVDGSVTLGEGVQVMAGAVVQPGCTIGAGSIINTRAGVDHDCTVGAHVHVAPGATLCGAVSVGDGAFLGAGCVVIQGVGIGARSRVAAGAVLTRSLALDGTLDRVPARTVEGVVR